MATFANQTLALPIHDFISTLFITAGGVKLLKKQVFAMKAKVTVQVRHLVLHAQKTERCLTVTCILALSTYSPAIRDTPLCRAQRFTLKTWWKGDASHNDDSFTAACQL